MTKPKKPAKKLSDFRPQAENANAHTERGTRLLNQSLHRVGWFTAMTATADGEVIDGSARLEEAVDRFGDDVEPIVIEHDGKRPVICVRTDIKSADEPVAKELAIAANVVAASNLSWDIPILLDTMEDVPLADWFLPSEIEEWGKDIPPIPEPEPLDLGGGKREIQCKCPNCGHSFVKV
jgi:hypothetical protein